jgi:putative transposase
MERFQDRYRISSARAEWWNYSAQGIYFITICTSGHDDYFGQVIDNQMILSDIGILAFKEWEKSFSLRQELFCDLYVIMPNHIHAILRIQNAISSVETHGGASPKGSSWGVAFRRPKSISSFVAGFKSMVTLKASKINTCFGWQSRFHDHIIRNHDDYQRIAFYIKNNPANWDHDEFFTKPL